MILNMAGYLIKLKVHYSTHQLIEKPDSFTMHVPSTYSGIIEEGSVEISMGFQRGNIIAQSYIDDQDIPVWDFILNLEKQLGIIRWHPRFIGLDPLDYPISHLLQYHLAVWGSGIIFHASAVSFEGFCALFMGRSGSGKTTLASWCQKAGGELIHDDRILVACIEGKFYARRMPSYPGQGPEKGELACIFLIHQSNLFAIQTLSTSESYEALLEHAVQYNHHPEIVRHQQASLQHLARNLNCDALSVPFDQEISTTIKNYTLYKYGS